MCVYFFYDVRVAKLINDLGGCLPAAEISKYNSADKI